LEHVPNHLASPMGASWVATALPSQLRWGGSSPGRGRQWRATGAKWAIPTIADIFKYVYIYIYTYNNCY